MERNMEYCEANETKKIDDINERYGAQSYDNIDNVHIKNTY